MVAAVAYNEKRRDVCIITPSISASATSSCDKSVFVSSTTVPCRTARGRLSDSVFRLDRCNTWSV